MKKPRLTFLSIALLVSLADCWIASDPQPTASPSLKKERMGGDLNIQYLFFN